MTEIIGFLATAVEQLARATHKESSVAIAIAYVREHLAAHVARDQSSPGPRGQECQRELKEVHSG